MSRCSALLSSIALTLSLAACGGGDPGIDPGAPDELLFQAGLADYDALRYAEAQASFNQLLADYPSSPRHDNAGYLAGRCRYEQLDYPAAITSLTTMRDAHPDSVFFPNATYYTGRARFKLGDYGPSVTDFDDAIAADPTGIYADNAAYFGGRARYEDGDTAAAVTALAAFETDWAGSTYLDNARYYLGRAQMTSGAYADAVAAFERVLTDPASIFADNAQLYLGVAEYDAGQLDAAFTALEALESSYPGSVLLDNGLHYEIRIRVDQLDCAAASTIYGGLAAEFPGILAGLVVADVHVHARVPVRSAFVGLISLGLAAPAWGQSEELSQDDAAKPDDTTAKPKKKKKKSKKKKSHRWETELAAEAELKVGVLTGRGTIQDGGGFARVGAEVTPAAEKDWLRLELPTEIFDRETVATTLPERGGAVEAQVKLRQGPRLRGGVHAGVGATWRPGWPDLYQPQAGGAFAETSRQSHWDREVGLEVAGIPLRHQHARLRYDYQNVDYDDDDDYDPIDAPTHLVPGDHEEHQLRASWKHHADTWKLGGELELDWEHWFKAYARDAGTGLTHAGSGGPPPNPLQRTFTVTPAIVGEVTRGDLELTFGYGIAFSSDRYDGYYSYIEQRPEVGASLPVGASITVELDVDVRWRGYGANSYAAEPPDRPALDFGERRSDRSLDADLALRRPIGGGLDAIAGVDLTARRTNFPDYVPSVYPAGRQYDVDWDYTNVTAWVGVAWSHGGSDDE